MTWIQFFLSAFERRRWAGAGMLLLCCSSWTGLHSKEKAEDETQKTPPLVEVLGHDTFVMDAVTDRQGRLWVATEDKGVFHLDPMTRAVTRYTTKEGLGSNQTYAVEVDTQGRLWVGTLNRGVSVFNGQAWKTYDVGEGVLGERVCDIKCNAANGDVWIATTAGLTRYCPTSDTWQQFTQTDGLPAEHITTIAIDERGTVYAGTECNGLAMARLQGDYAQWLPLRIPSISGAVSDPNYINDILVGDRGVLYVATPAGLLIGLNGGRTWKLIGTGERGRGNTYSGNAAWTSVLPGLSADYVTCVSRTLDGQIWAGHWRNGYSIVDEKTHEALPQTPGYVGYARAIVHTPTASWICSYGDGLICLPRKGASAQSSSEGAKADKGQVVSLPAPCSAPASVDLEKLVAALKREPNAGESMVWALNDDWRTQGRWLGRYGRYWACLGAFRSPDDYVWGAGEAPIDYHAFIGPKCQKYDSIRRWVHWLYTSENRTLEIPPTYLDGRIMRGMTTPDKDRRQSEWDDHGEAYPMTFNGPHLYFSLEIPKGLFMLSFYDFNKDGHERFNRFRDYRISIRRRPAIRKPDDVSDFAAWPELARGRIKDFWGGCHKRYVVRGPLSLTVEVNRNHSFNTILASIMVDHLDETPPPYFGGEEEWAEGQEERIRRMQSLGGGYLVRNTSTGSDVVMDLHDQLDRLRLLNPKAWARWQRRGYVALYQHLKASIRGEITDACESTQRLFATCQYQLQFFDGWEDSQRALGLQTAREIEKAVRWDRFSTSNSGQGRENVLRTMKQLREDREWEEHRLQAERPLPAGAR